MNNFELLRKAGTLVNAGTTFYQLINDWADKREMVHVMCSDLPILRDQYLLAKTEAFAPDPRYTLSIDPAPRVRLKAAVESTVNALYGLADVAANFGSQLTKASPASFNALIKWVAKQGDSQLKATMADSDWYSKVRELRTEWAHYSTVFVSHGRDNEVTFIARNYRRPCDKNHFTDVASVTLEELVSWTRAAIQCIDLYAGYLASKYMLPKYDPETTLTCIVPHSNGLPRLFADGRLETCEITTREYFARFGIDIDLYRST